jgi:hypothetical protein
MPRKKIEPKPNKKYSTQHLQLAIQKLKSKELSLRKASTLFKVPRSTLYDHLTGKSQSIGVGSATILSKATEELLVHMLVTFGDWGYGLKFRQNQSILKVNIINFRFSR